MATNKQLRAEFLNAVEILEGYDSSKAEKLMNELVGKITQLTTAYDIKKRGLNLQLKRAQAVKEQRGYNRQLSDLEAKLERDKADAYRRWTKRADDAIRVRRKKS